MAPRVFDALIGAITDAFREPQGKPQWAIGLAPGTGRIPICNDAILCERHVFSKWPTIQLAAC